MKKTNIRKLYYHFTHRYLSLNNVVIAVALFVGMGWAWGSVQMMQRNFDLQKEVDAKLRLQQLAELQTQNLAYEQRYYKTSEYQELAVRERLGLAKSGEKVLILPPNSEVAKAANLQLSNKKTAPSIERATNLEQWMNFFFGGARKN